MEGRQDLGAPPSRLPYMIIILSLAQQHRAWHTQIVQKIVFSLSNEFDLETVDFEEIARHAVWIMGAGKWLRIMSFTGKETIQGRGSN